MGKLTPGGVVNCYDCEEAEDLVEVLEDLLPISEYLDQSFTNSGLRLVFWVRIGFNHYPTGSNVLPVSIDKSCGESWEQAVDRLEIHWDALDIFAQNSAGGSVDPGLDNFGSGNDDIFGCLETRSRVLSTRSCSDGVCVSSRRVVSYLARSPGCIG